MLIYTNVSLFLQAIKAGLKILEEGGTLDEAKAVCPVDALNQLTRWNVFFIFLNSIVPLILFMFLLFVNL